MTRTVKDCINEMAGEIMLHCYGRIPSVQTGEGLPDYSKSKSYQRKNCFKAACAAWKVLEGDLPDLEVNDKRENVEATRNRIDANLILELRGQLIDDLIQFNKLCRIGGGEENLPHFDSLSRYLLLGQLRLKYQLEDEELKAAIQYVDFGMRRQADETKPEE